MNETLKRKLDEAAYTFVTERNRYSGREEHALTFKSGASFMHTELISVINDLMLALEHYANEEMWFEATCLGGPDVAKAALAKCKERLGEN